MGSFSNTALSHPSCRSLDHRGSFPKHPIAPKTGSPAHTRTSLAQSPDLNCKPTQTTLLVCLSRDAPCISLTIGSLRGHPSISYIWLNSLTFNPITIILRKKHKNIKKEKGKTKNISILTLITNLTSKNAKLT